MPLVITILSPLGSSGTEQDQVARQLLGLNTLGSLVLHPDGTRVEWNPFGFAGPTMVATGADLTTDGIELTGGTITGFELLDPNSGTTRSTAAVGLTTFSAWPAITSCWAMPATIGFLAGPEMT